VCHLSLEDQQHIQIHLISARIVPELHQLILTEMSKIHSVQSASQRGLLYSDHLKKRRKQLNTTEVDGGGGDEDVVFMGPLITPGGFATIAEISQMENNGEDISDFQPTRDIDSDPNSPYQTLRGISRSNSAGNNSAGSGSGTATLSSTPTGSPPLQAPANSPTSVQTLLFFPS